MSSDSTHASGSESTYASGAGSSSPGKSALDVQVGGGHYKSMAIQPVEFCQRNRLGFCESNAIKYVCRHRNKNGREDLLKAIHYINLLLELEYPPT